MKVVLNALPPARLDTPSAALSILKAFLKQNGVETDVIYWNLLLDGLLPSCERDTDAIEFTLLPYLYMLADDYGDDIARAKANALIKARLPLRDKANRNSDYWADARSRMAALAAQQFASYDANAPLLFGIPCKYEQWIPGLILARLIKTTFPKARVVLGGLRNRDKADAVMAIGEPFDFAIWGEGEYPLLALSRALENEADDFDAIPRLLYRRGGTVRASDNRQSAYFDLNGRIFPDYDDYFRTREATGHRHLPAILPLESSRGCTWNACRFCVCADGYETRKKEPAALKQELQYLLDKYPTPFFAFMDNDIVANDLVRLEQILDDLIALRRTRDFQLIAELIPKRFTPALIKKLFRAGMARVHFGYEALTDGLLKKMRKRNTFADNLFFVKFAHKYKIKLPSANVICGVIGETDADILESIDNLHFLRFYCDKDVFVHNPIPLRVAKHSAFYDMLAPEALARWDDNALFSLLPARMTEGLDRFSLFDFAGKPARLWESFSRLNDFYYDHRYSFTLSMEDHAWVYREFFDGDVLTVLTLSDLEVRILLLTHDRILDFKALTALLGPEAGGTDAKEVAVRAALGRLRYHHLIYVDEAGTAIVAVLDMDQAEAEPSRPAVFK